MASANFRNLAVSLANADIDFGVDTFKTLLVSAVPSEAQLDTWANRSDVTTEITGTGYTAGGVAQPVSVGALDTANNRVPIDLSDLAAAWTGATISAVGAIVYKSTGSAATDKLVAFVDFGSTVAVTGGSYGIDYTSPIYLNV